MEIMTHKYYPRILVINQNDAKILYDEENNTTFIFKSDGTHLFKDENFNTWSTVPKSFTLNKQILYPVIGTVYERSDGISHFFTTKEIVISKAKEYFEKFINKGYGLEQHRGHEFFFVEGKRFVGSYCSFKSLRHNKINAFISEN